MTGFDWSAALARAHAAGIPPAVFWSLTPRELKAILQPSRPQLSRAGLAALLARWPDEPSLQNKEYFG